MPSTTDKEPTDSTPNEQKNNSADWWKDHSPELLLALFTFFLWLATRDLVKGAEKTSKDQLRAYISIIGAEPVKKAEGGRHFGFKINFKNAGQTPAYNLVSGASIDTAPFPRTAPLKTVALTEKSSSTIGPGVTTSLFPTRSTLTPEERASLENKTRALYIHGRIEYRDVFQATSDRPRVTYFTLVYRKTEAGVYIIGNDKDGNDAT